MTTDFNEINRKLQGRIDPVLLNVIQELYLMLAEIEKQSALNAKVAVDLAKSLHSMIGIQTMFQDRLLKLQRTLNPSGIEWKSESN